MNGRRSKPCRKFSLCSARLTSASFASATARSRASSSRCYWSPPGGSGASGTSPKEAYVVTIVAGTSDDVDDDRAWYLALCRGLQPLAAYRPCGLHVIRVVQGGTQPHGSLTTAQALARWIGADPAPLALTAATHSA